MTVAGKPKRGAFHPPWKSLRDSHIPTARLLLYIFLKTYPRKEPSSPPAPFSFRLILRLEKSRGSFPWIHVLLLGHRPNCLRTYDVAIGAEGCERSVSAGLQGDGQMLRRVGKGRGESVGTLSRIRKNGACYSESPVCIIVLSNFTRVTQRQSLRSL